MKAVVLGPGHPQVQQAVPSPLDKALLAGQSQAARSLSLVRARSSPWGWARSVNAERCGSRLPCREPC